MKKYWYKLLSWIGFEIEEIPEDKPVKSSTGDPIIDKADSIKHNNNIISIHQNKPVKIVYISPENYEQVQSIADHLRSFRPVIVNMESIEKDLAKRILDFLSGTTYAISGSMEKINSNIVIVLPQSFSVVNLTEVKDAPVKGEYLAWNKTSES
ncbi:cell division protein SepF [Desulfitibacter alkalitolerans]|uniref:cell division protein SepF n=1 Tax=Desulfitibacter alkalitolerans TaxID=264641 RepID=UPI000688FFCB|nr:cell division protein SepF [Desulfitibacter alkalitolerans]